MVNEVEILSSLIPIFEGRIFPGGGGHSKCERGYQARPKIHVIRVVFQDQALYARTSFRGAKRVKLEKKGVFSVI